VSPSPFLSNGRAERAKVALALALLTGLVASARAIHEPQWPTDFDQLWFAARALITGDDPYSVVGPGRPFYWNWPLYYPLQAVILVVPLAWLPVAVARVVFSTVAAGILGWAMGRRVLVLWPLALSAAYIISASRTQWAPLLLAAAWSPAFGAVLTAKPNVGFASFAALSPRGMRIAAAGCAFVTLLSLLLRPDWVSRWREAIAASPHISAPILLPGGVLLALALLRWRRSEARLLLAMACIPHTPSLYDLLLLFFACRTLRETLFLAILTHVLYWCIVTLGPFKTFDDYALSLGKLAIFVVYLPVLVMVLRRPNKSASPPLPLALEPSSLRPLLPGTRIDAILILLLALCCATLLWLPLVTYR